VVGDGTPFPPYHRDPQLHYHSTTHPGAYLPHVWLERNQTRLSTLDLARGGRFSLLTGIGGRHWIEAATRVDNELEIDIAAYCIGLRQEHDDVLGQWTRYREVRDHGCVLVRPDGYIAWRSRDGAVDPTGDLRRAMSQLLARDEVTTLGTHRNRHQG
jgi:2,4-dichlorophenol 6-monooxygenase